MKTMSIYIYTGKICSTLALLLSMNSGGSFAPPLFLPFSI